MTVEIFDKIRQWTLDRNLQEGDPKGQVLKLLEESGELASGLAKDNEAEVKDAIGDIVVVLTVLSLQLGIDIEECIELAYTEIKDRKGRQSFIYLAKLIDNVSGVNEVIRDMEVGINDNGVLYVRIERTDLSAKYIKRICRSFENQGARVE